MDVWMMIGAEVRSDELSMISRAYIPSQDLHSYRRRHAPQEAMDLGIECHGKAGYESKRSVRTGLPFERLV